MSYKSNIQKADRTSETATFPDVVLIDNCNACNLRCSMCDHVNLKNHRRIQTMDKEIYRKIIDEIALENPTARVWEIFFGDPFMCRDMAWRIKYAKDKGLTDVVLNSNAVLMSPPKARKMIESGLDAMYVGIDAANAATYEKIRVGGNYDRAVRNVMSYKTLLDKYGSKDQRLFVQFVVSDINKKELDDFKRFWLSNGINVKIRPKISWAGLVGANNLYDNNAIDRKSCYWLMQTMNICANGDVALCSVDIHCRVNCGNVVESDLKDIWNDQLSYYRRMQNEKRFDELPEMCRSCRDWQSAYAEFFNPHQK